MFFRRKKGDGCAPAHEKKVPGIKLRIAIWSVALFACGFFSFLVLTSRQYTGYDYDKVECLPQGDRVYEAAPGSVVQQSFTALGRSVGECSHLYLNVARKDASDGSLSMQLYEEETGKLLAQVNVNFSDLPLYANCNEELPEQVMLGDGGFYYLNSGKHYLLEITNHSEAGSVYLFGNADIQSGTLRIDGEQQPGFLNLSLMRMSLYRPFNLLILMIGITDFTVLAGLGLVLFTRVKTHFLYLVLAVGFGTVTLFDLTPLYGFDMRFQFDSTYVLSNEIMGLGGITDVPKQSDPGQTAKAYPRRTCDDYSQYQFYYSDEVSANYTDTRAGIRNLFAAETEQDLIMAETNLGFISDQLYLYLPQALAFTVARLLGLGMYPMLELARAAVYAVFVTTMFFSIRSMPFGKRILLILSLIPTVMVQTVSITRDAMIICMSFFLIAKVLQLAYAEKTPKFWDWLLVLGVSVLLAPCKMIYLPVSCFCLLIVYRHYIRGSDGRWKKAIPRIAIVGAVLLGTFLWLNWGTVMGVLNAASVSLYQTEGYSIPAILANPLRALYVFGNTVRSQMGTYLVNAVQLFDIRLGCSDGITLIVFALLILESFYADAGLYDLRKGERIFMLLVAAGVFLLTALASLRWTPIDSNVIEGLQGRYLTPILPLLCLAWHNNRTIRISTDVTTIVSAGCCVFPAISLMNMYLWTITC